MMSKQLFINHSKRLLTITLLILNFNFFLTPVHASSDPFAILLVYNENNVIGKQHYERLLTKYSKEKITRIILSANTKFTQSLDEAFFGESLHKNLVNRWNLFEKSKLIRVGVVAPSNTKVRDLNENYLRNELKIREKVIKFEHIPIETFLPAPLLKARASDILGKYRDFDKKLDQFDLIYINLALIGQVKFIGNAAENFFPLIFEHSEIELAIEMPGDNGRYLKNKQKKLSQLHYATAIVSKIPKKAKSETIKIGLYTDNFDEVNNIKNTLSDLKIRNSRYPNIELNIISSFDNDLRRYDAIYVTSRFHYILPILEHFLRGSNTLIATENGRNLSMSMLNIKFEYQAPTKTISPKLTFNRAYALIHGFSTNKNFDSFLKQLDVHYIDEPKFNQVRLSNVSKLIDDTDVNIIKFNKSNQMEQTGRELFYILFAITFLLFFFIFYNVRKVKR